MENKIYFLGENYNKIGVLDMDSHFQSSVEVSRMYKTKLMLSFTLENSSRILRHLRCISTQGAKIPTYLMFKAFGADYQLFNARLIRVTSSTTPTQVKLETKWFVDYAEVDVIQLMEILNKC